MKRTLALLLTVVVVLITAHQLPAPISEIPESPTPAPEQSPKPKPKRAIKPQEVTEESKPSAELPLRASTTKKELAVIKTGEGEMVAELWSDVAPNTVENFKKLARSGFYDGTAFHRIVKGFMIQGGDPLTKDLTNEARYGTGDPGYTIKAEFNRKSHERGVLSMARSSDPDSAGSQFFICLANVSRLDNQYTTFGRVIRGDGVLAKIGDIPTITSNSGEESKPTRRVTVESIRIISAPQ
jgi:peptidyl-prolyl cis-trans isomerase B (cyclophilin B)